MASQQFDVHAEFLSCPLNLLPSIKDGSSLHLDMFQLRRNYCSPHLFLLLSLYRLPLCNQMD